MINLDNSWSSRIVVYGPGAPNIAYVPLQSIDQQE